MTIHRIPRRLSLLFLVLAVCAARASPQGSAFHPAFEAALAEQKPGKAVSRIGALSDYVPSLAGTALDSPVYHIHPGPGIPARTTDAAAALPAILVLGGTHGDEIAGVLAASLFVSLAEPLASRLIVVPRANASAATWPDPDRPGPPEIRIRGVAGERVFRYGSRFTKPQHEVAGDPPRYLPPGAGPGQDLAGREARNLNRSYPGNDSGTGAAPALLTARAAAAILTLIRTENVKAAFDLHEAGPSSGLAWNIVANPKNLDHAASGIFAADERGVRMVLERSREYHHGFSHLEWGNRTAAAAYLIETLNPGQVSGGKPELDHLGNARSPLWKRVGIHVETVLAILSAHSDMDARTGWAAIDGMPGLDDLERRFADYF